MTLGCMKQVTEATEGSWEPRSEKGKGNVPGEEKGEGKGAGCWGEGEPYCILDAGTLKFKDDRSQRLPRG